MIGTFPTKQTKQDVIEQAEMWANGWEYGEYYLAEAVAQRLDLFDEEAEMRGEDAYPSWIVDICRKALAKDGR